MHGFLRFEGNRRGGMPRRPARLAALRTCFNSPNLTPIESNSTRPRPAREAPCSRKFP
ncbi:hypothetical protein BCEN4_340015 [Burkholderia cenocepacia]|nr:hypothetical protein BCEN4_340015 [Burkholderia cenocepacia]